MREAIRSRYGVPTGTKGTEGVRLPSKRTKKRLTRMKGMGNSLANSGTATGKTVGETGFSVTGSTTGLTVAGPAGATGGLDSMSIMGRSIATLDSTVAGSTVGEDCAYQVPISPIAVRREKLAKSMFPREAIVDNNLLERVRLDWEERAAIIDYEKFCK